MNTAKAGDAPAKGRPWGRWLGDALFALLMVALLGGTIAFSLNRDPHKSIFGYRFYDAMSSSMAPALGHGDLIIVKVQGPEGVEPGDIITYATDDTGQVTVTHRVTSIGRDDAGGYVIQTKGDANNAPDKPITGDRMIGVVAARLPLAGGILQFLRANAPYVLIVVAVVILAISGVWYVLRRPRKGQGDLTDEQSERDG